MNNLQTQKIIKKVILFILLVFCTNSQASDEIKPNSFIILSFGYYEPISLAIGYNLTDNWGIAIKSNILFFKNDILNNSGAAIGIKLHRRTFNTLSYKLFDTINLETSTGKNILHSKFISCSEVQLNISSEKSNIYGINFIYSIGYGYSYEKYNGGLFSPTIKIGFIYNITL